MKKLYMVMYGEEKGGYSKIKAAFTKKEDAIKASKGYGFWGSDGVVKILKLYDTYEEYLNNEEYFKG